MRAPVTALLGAIVATSAVSRAEVRATGAGSRVGALILCDCPQASPFIWQATLSPVSSQTLNPSGAQDGDLPPALAISSERGTPTAVWAEWDGSDFEITLSRFDGGSWSPQERLTDNSLDDTQPTVASREDGSTAVVWRAGLPVPRIQYRQHQTSGVWSPVIDVSDGSQSAMSPAVIATNGRVHVSFVEIGGDGSKIVKVAGGGDEADPWPTLFVTEIIAITDWNGELAPGLFSAPSGPISIWTDSPTSVGFSRFNGVTWTTPQFEPYAGAADLEAARIRAKRRALHGP